MKQILPFFCVFLLYGLLADAQSISRFAIVPYGDFSSNSNVSLSSTLGEVMIKTFTSETLILTQGFQQPLIISDVGITMVEDGRGIRTYPNPVLNELQIEITLNVPEDLIFEVFDVIGNRILLKKYDYPGNSFDYKMDMSGIETGIYILRIYSTDKSFIKSIKLQKQ